MRGLAVVVVAVLMSCSTGCGVQGDPGLPGRRESTPRTVTVFGQGRMALPADIVDVTVVVEVKRPRLDNAYQGLQNEQVQLAKALTALGVGRGDMIVRSYESTPAGVPLDDRSMGARMRQWLGVTVRDMSSYAEIVGAIIDLNQEIVDVRFGSTRASSLEVQAHERAVIDAQTRALALAGELRAKLGRPLTVRELTPSEANELAGVLRPELDIAPRSQFEVSSTVEVTFELSDV